MSTFSLWEMVFIAGAIIAALTLVLACVLVPLFILRKGVGPKY